MRRGDQINLRYQRAKLGRFDETMEEWDLSPARGAGAVVTFSADDQAAEVALGSLVVQGDSRIEEEAHEQDRQVGALQAKRHVTANAAPIREQSRGAWRAVSRSHVRGGSRPDPKTSHGCEAPGHCA
jgi:hypothetical protein